MDKPRISFGIIVLNGEPFTKYCLRSLYPFAHEIIVVEGGHENTRTVCTPDGHSVDGTLESLWRFKQEEDPENKVQIITRDGFWPMKDELGRYRTHQCRAYTEKATGDYLWQVDIDEFYREEDMKFVINRLRQDPDITAVSFKTQTFWGAPSYIVDSWPLRRGLAIFHRLFKWGPGYRYVTHEPPTVCDEKGRDLRSLKWIKGEVLARQGIYMYHYSFLFPWQVYQKMRVYQDEKRSNYGKIFAWYENNYSHIGHPYRAYSFYQYPGWFERFYGKHPLQVMQMMKDIYLGKIKIDLRRTDDIEKLLNSWWYSIGALWLKLLEPIDRFLKWAENSLVKLFITTKNLIPFLRRYSVTGTFRNIIRFFLGKRNPEPVNICSSFEEYLSKIIMHNQINLILDIGAGKGSFSRLMRNEGYEDRIIAFEPISEAFSYLSEFAKNDPCCKCYKVALGAQDGSANINVSNNLTSSSLLSMLPQHLKSAPDSYTVRTERVEVKRLDSFCSKWLKPTDRIFIKMDVQGYEKEVLLGAKEILPFTQLIQLELSCVPLYEGQPLYQDMLNMMRENGFGLVLLNPVFNDPITGHMLQFDAVFERINTIGKTRGI